MSLINLGTVSFENITFPKHVTMEVPEGTKFHLVNTSLIHGLTMVNQKGKTENFKGHTQGEKASINFTFRASHLI